MTSASYYSFFASYLDRFLSFVMLPLSLLKERHIKSRWLSDSSPFNPLLQFGLVNLTNKLPLDVSSDLIQWIDSLTCLYLNNNSTYRKYDPHLEIPLPESLCSYLNPFLNFYFASSNWIVDQTQWQVSFPSQSPPPGYGFHIDSFYPSLKLFIYKGKVDSSNGAMRYIPKSHLITPSLWKRALWSLSRHINLTYFPCFSETPFSLVTSDKDYSFFLCDMRTLHSSSFTSNGMRVVAVVNYRKRFVYF